jgi:hypothetical protein
MDYVIESSNPRDFRICDIWIFVETFALKDFHIEDFYGAHSHARPPKERGRPSGGVSVLSSAKIGPLRVIRTMENGLILTSGYLNIIALYVNPTTHPDDMLMALLEASEDIDLSIPSVIAGDFNCRIDKSRLPHRTLALKRTLHDLGFWVVNRPEVLTYHASNGASTIDLFAVNWPRSSTSTPTRLSLSPLAALRKHMPMRLIIRSIMPLHQDSTKAERIPPSIDNATLESLIPEILSFFLTNADVNSIADCLANAIRASATQCNAKKRTSKPWFNAACYKLRENVLTALKSAESSDEAKQTYILARRAYKALTKVRKKEWTVEKETKMIREAEEAPYKYKANHQKGVICPIPSEELRAHFLALAQADNTIPTNEPVQSNAHTQEQQASAAKLNEDFTQYEVQLKIDALKPKKVGGPDGIRPEHMKSCKSIWGCWLALFNICLNLGTIPDIWKTCMLVVIPKGKGDPSLPTSWRGISKKCIPGKVLSAMMSNRLYDYLASCSLLPPNQHGFMRGLSTETAVAQLLGAIYDRLAAPKQPLYVCFVDFRAAFDSASRTEIIKSLAVLGIGGRFLKLITAMLGKNDISIHDGVRELPKFQQTTGLPQGDNISSILFNVLLHEIPTVIMRTIETVIAILYADDLALTAPTLGELERAIRKLIELTRGKGLTINWEKTKIMKFRRGGRLAASDTICIEGHQIEFVSSFSYLGFELTSNASAFGKHIAERKRKALFTMLSIPDVRMLSVKTAIELFRLKIAPIAAYGIRVIWGKLKVSDLEALDKIKSTYLKRALGVSKFAKNRLVYLLADTASFIEDLMTIYNLEHTAASIEFKRRLELKFAEVNEDFLHTLAMRNDSWKSPMYQQRHSICRAAVHGFHDKYCHIPHCHSETPACTCKFCWSHCAQYHLLTCVRSPFKTLKDHDDI